MSDPIDFAAILGDRLAHSIQGEPITDVYTPTGVGTYQLAAKVPELCPDCDAHGCYQKRFPDGGRATWPCDHRNAPTIGGLLRQASLVWRDAHPAQGFADGVCAGCGAVGPVFCGYCSDVDE